MLIFLQILLLLLLDFFNHLIFLLVDDTNVACNECLIDLILRWLVEFDWCFLYLLFFLLFDVLELDVPVDFLLYAHLRIFFALLVQVQRELAPVIEPKVRVGRQVAVQNEFLDGVVLRDQNIKAQLEIVQKQILILVVFFVGVADQPDHLHQLQAKVQEHFPFLYEVDHDSLVQQNLNLRLSFSCPLDQLVIISLRADVYLD